MRNTVLIKMQAKVIQLLLISFMLSNGLWAQNCGNWTDISLPGTSQIPQQIRTANNTLFAIANYEDLYKSTDNGVTWQICSITFQNGGAGNISVQYSLANNTYYLGYYGELFKSTNNGSSWISCPQNAENLYYVHNDSLFFDYSGSKFKLSIYDIGTPGINPVPVSNFRYFVKTSTNYFYFTFVGGITTIYRSSTGIYNGTDISASFPASQQYLSGVMAKGDSIFTIDGFGKKMYFSTDEGNTWSLFYDYNGTGAMAVSVAITPSDFYIFKYGSGGYYSNIISSSDNGATWQSVGLSSTNTFYGVCNNALFTISWTVNSTSIFRIVSGLATPIPLSPSADKSIIHFAQQSQDKILLSTSNGVVDRIFYSNNNGSNFAELTGYNGYITSGLVTSQALILNTDYNAQLSYNQGASWQNCPGNTRYIAKGDTIYGFQNAASGTVYYSNNGGLSFNSTPVAQNYFNAACVNGGFVTNSLSNSADFSYFNNTNLTHTTFNVNFLSGGYWLKAADFAGKKILITSDSTTINIGYSSNNFQTVQQAVVNTSINVFPTEVYIENNKLIIACTTGYLESTDGITFNDVVNQDTCISHIVLKENSKKIACKYFYDPFTSLINQTKLYLQDTPQSCDAFFTLVPDTLPQHYYALNQSTGSGNLSFVWNWGDGSPSSSGNNPSHVYSTAGLYNICVTVSDGNGCTDSYCDTTFVTRSDTIIYIDVVFFLPYYLKVKNIEAKDDLIMLYPNPSNGIFMIKNSESIHSIEIFNMLGDLLLTQGNAKIIDLQNYPKGIYLARINGMQKFRLLKE